MYRQNNFKESSSFEKKLRFILFVLCAFVLLGAIAWQIQNLSRISKYKVQEPVIDPIVYEFMYKYDRQNGFGGDWREFLARNINETVITLKKDDNFFGSKQEVDPALVALAKGDITLVKELFIKVSKKTGLNNKKAAEIYRNLGTFANLSITTNPDDSTLEANRNYSLATKLDPENINGWSNAGSFLKDQAEKEIDYGRSTDSNKYKNYDKLFEDAVATYNKVLALANKQDNLLEKARVYIDLGTLYRNTSGRFKSQDKAIEFYEKALKIYEALNVKGEMADTSGKIAELLAFIDDKKAAFYYEKTLALIGSLNNKEAASRIYHNLAFFYGSRDPEKAIEYYKKDLAINESIGREYDIQNTYNNIAQAYQQLGNNEEVINYYQKLLSLSERNRNDLWVAYVSTNIGEIYFKQREWGKALQLYQRALPIFERSNNKEDVGMTFYKISLIYEKQDNKTQAKDALKKSLAISKVIKNSNRLKEVEGWNLAHIHLVEDWLETMSRIPNP